MTNVSRPLVALLVATLAFFALWTVALRPGAKSSGGSSASQSSNALSGDAAAAHKAVGTADHASAAAGQVPSATSTSAKAGSHATSTTSHATTPTTPTAHPTATTAAVHATATTPTAHTTSTTHVHITLPVSPLHAVTQALEQHRVVALLVYNPAASDDVAVKRELASIPSPHHKVFKLAVQVGSLGNYSSITTALQVNQSPTLLVIDSHDEATKVVGYASQYEIAQRVLDALKAQH